MATAYITEYGGTGAERAQIAAAPAVASQTVAIGTEAKSAAFNNNTRLIRVHVDAICSILIGSNPTATTASARMSADSTEYFGVNPGDKISVITNT
jgi:hypothetical protein